MDRETIIKLAREAGIPVDITAGNPSTAQIEHFAKLVAEHVIKSAPDYKMGYADGVAAEREQCAKLCEEDGLLWGQRYAAAIRARGKP